MSQVSISLVARTDPTWTLQCSFAVDRMSSCSSRALGGAELMELGVATLVTECTHRRAS